ncbi:MAG TPA: universal stress protein [Anaeromyxobacteraceae bacterium]|nr:universal stress protein [Anaeromyxobacteraceae bacterium]
MTAIKRILVPIDFSASSRAALTHAVELRTAFGAGVSVLHVHEATGFIGYETFALMPMDHPSRRWEHVRGEMLRELEGFLGRSRLAVDEIRVEAGVPDDVIPAVARDGDFDLILMGTHGQGTTSRLALGNVAEGVMRKAHCLVMTVRVPHRVAREAVYM